jgi:prophage regulatory protein
VPNKEIRQEPAQERFVREHERARITGIPTSSWYTMMNRGLAPRGYRLGPRTVAWRLSELTEWIGCQTNGDSWVRVGDAAGRVVDKLSTR